MKLAPAYQPHEYENKLYELWEKGGVFSAHPESDKPRFSISMPPPNETGSLHAGHAIFLTLQDLMVRRARQEGKDVLWLPGTDHAALAVNALMEKQLAEQGTDKHTLGREKFVSQTRDFVTKNRGNMIAQIRALGASCDWGRARYTLDPALSRCVNEVFVKMYNDGLIYRGHRIVNWDPNLQTTVSDDEVVRHEEKAPLYTLQFGPFQITTARPETKFGDKYVVMHPDDERYREFKDGESFETEWINGKVTATVVKDEAVDPRFGTGVMTITPWHDSTDFDIAERHGLEKVQVIDFDGRLMDIAGEFAGMNIEEARPKIVAKLENKKLLVSTDEKYSHAIALNDRGKGVIEPQIKLQWFIDVNRPAVEWKGQLRSLKEVMRAVIDDGDIKIVPKRFEKVYFHWIDNLRDWNISRQIWWGHQIPIWYKGEEIYCGVLPPEEQGWEQDSDTLDTWFSSALWTWSTLIDTGLAEDYHLSLEDLLAQSKDFQTYHPTSVMETGWDILFFWVARMILATTYTMSSTHQPEDKRVPFRTVYLHGLVRTEQGKKMSKSDPEGSVDPSEVVEEYGADALRLALISGAAPGADQRLGRDRIVAGRNFNNKLWNIARFAENLEERDASAPQTPADNWILNKLSITAAEVGARLTDFRFSEAYDSLYHFIWDDLADWYVEACKVKNAASPAVLKRVLGDSLRLVHPFAPFVSEAIWQELQLGKGLLAGEPAPSEISFDKTEAAKFQTIVELVSAARRISGALKIKLPAIYYSDSLNEDLGELVRNLARAGEVKKVAAAPDNSWRLALQSSNVWVKLSQEQIDNYRRWLGAHIEELQKSTAALKARLANKDYLNNAPPELVSETKKLLREQGDLLQNRETELKN